MVETYKNKFNKRHGFPKAKSHSIAEIARLSKISVGQARKIVEKGKAAYFNNPQSVRPQVKSATQWGIARLYSFYFNKGKTFDTDLIKKYNIKFK